MAEVKWIKICTDIFDDEKILFIENMPEADSLIVIWFKLLCMAGKQNNSGVFKFNDTMAYTDEMFATIFRRPVNTVRLALKTFESYGMVKIINNAVTIPNWEKHQRLDALERNKEKTRQRVATYREKQKLLATNDCNGCNEYGNVTVTLCNDDRREEKRIEEDKSREEEHTQRACAREESEKVSPSIQSVFDFWNEQNIIVHRELTSPLIMAIKKAVAEYSESSVKEFIKRYKTVLDDRSYFFSYKWSLLDFLTRKAGIAAFTDEGSKWADYMAKREHKCLLDGTRIDEEDYPW